MELLDFYICLIGKDVSVGVLMSLEYGEKYDDMVGRGE